MASALLWLFGVIVAYKVFQIYQNSTTQNTIQNSIQNSTTGGDCPPQRYLGKVTWGFNDFGTPNHYTKINKIPCSRNFTYSNDLKSLSPGQPPNYQTNCYQFPCPENGNYTGSDYCWRCGEKPWAGPVRVPSGCPTPESPCSLAKCN